MCVKINLIIKICNGQNLVMDLRFTTFSTTPRSMWTLTTPSKKCSICLARDLLHNSRHSSRSILSTQYHYKIYIWCDVDKVDRAFPRAQILAIAI